MSAFKTVFVLVECPRCGKHVKLEKDKLAPHDKGTCTGSRMVWESCTGSGMSEEKNG